MKVSVVIPTYNKLARLKLALASLKSQTYPLSEYEVIIINNGSTDGTTQFLEKYEAPFKCKCINMGNMGRAAARNMGVKHSDNELIIFTDDDLILCPSFISEHISLQSKGYKVVHGKIVNLTYLKFFEDPTNGILYPGLTMNNSSLDEIRKKCISEKDIVEQFESAIARNNKISAFESAINEVLALNSPKAAWIGFTGGNVSLLKHWIDEVGGFDEKFGLKWGCEDLELGYRLYLKEHSYSYGVKAVNYHLAHYRHNFESEHAQTAEYFFSKYGDKKILYLQGFIAGTMKKEEFISYITA